MAETTVAASALAIVATTALLRPTKVGVKPDGRRRARPFWQGLSPASA
jgi:hypothetical protein